MQALREHGLSDAKVFDIAAAVGARAFFTKVLDALGVLADAPFGDLDPALRDALTVGRPLDTRPPVTLPEVDAGEPPAQ